MQTRQQIFAVTMLFLSWIFLFVMVSLTTTWGLSPWDGLLEIPPSVHEWELALNHFVDKGVGKYLFSIPVILIGAYTWWKTARQGRSTTVQLALSNLIFTVLFGHGLALASKLNQVLFPIPSSNYLDHLGFHLSILPFGMFIILFVMWLRYQTYILHDQRKTHTEHDTVDNTIMKDSSSEIPSRSTSHEFAQHQTLSDGSSDRFTLSSR